MACFERSSDGRRGAEVGEVVERAPGPPRVEPAPRAREEPEQVGLRKAVQVDDEVELAPPHVHDELPDLPHRQVLRPVAQRHAVNGQRLVGHARHLQHRRGRPPHRHRHTRPREPVPHGGQRRQTQNHVPQLPEIYHQNVARLKAHHGSSNAAAAQDVSRKSRPVMSAGWSRPRRPRMVGAMSSRAPSGRSLVPRESGSIKWKGTGLVVWAVWG